nr:YkgJ family cysteine cluster protein [Paenibacillus curdlanolyticus]
MPAKNRSELENQHRFYGTCIFYDLNKNRCGIHSVRPAICRAFGHYNNLICFKKPEAASRKNWTTTENPIGILSTDFTWKDFK